MQQWLGMSSAGRTASEWHRCSPGQTRAHSSPRTGQAVALKAKLNPAQPWQGVCWYTAGAGQALVLGGCSGDLEGTSAAVCRAQGAFSIPCHLAVCSVSPSAHSVLLHSQLPSWGCNSAGLSPEESEGLCGLLTFPGRMTEISALPSAREVYFQPSFYSASSVPWMRCWLGSWVYLQSAWVQREAGARSVVKGTWKEGSVCMAKVLTVASDKGKDFLLIF